MSFVNYLSKLFSIDSTPGKRDYETKLYQIYCIFGAIITPLFVYIAYGFTNNQALTFVCFIITGVFVFYLALSKLSQSFQKNLGHVLFVTLGLFNVYTFIELHHSGFAFEMLMPFLFCLMATSITAPAALYPIVYSGVIIVLSFFFLPLETADISYPYFISYVLGVATISAIVQRYKRLIINKLKNNEKFLSTIFNNTHEAILLVDFFSRKVIDCNDVTLKLFDLDSKDDIVGKPRDIFETENLDEKELVLCRKEMKLSGSWSRTIPHKTAKGKHFTGELTISPIKISDAQYYIVRIKDITEKVEAEKAIKETQEQISTIIANIEEVVYRVDLTGDEPILDYISPQVVNVFGYSKEEYNSRKTSLKQYYHPEDLPKLQEQLDQYRKDLKPTTLTYRFTHIKTGVEKWIEEAIYPQLNEEREHVANFGVARDATEKIAKEKELAESRDQLNDLLSNIDDIVYNISFSKDGNKTIEYVSPQIATLSGYTVDEFKEQIHSGEVVNNFHPDDLEYVRRTVKSVYEKKVPISMTYRYFSKTTQDYMWLEEKMFPKLDESGNHVGNMGIIRDFSERKLYENTLKRNQDRLSMILNNIDEMVYNISLDEEGGKTIEYVSPQIERLFGINEGEYIEKSKTGELIERYHPEDIINLTDIQDKIKKQKKAVTVKYRFKPQHKEEYSWFEERIFPQFNEEGRHIAQFGIVRDVTASISSEQQLKISERSYKDIFNNSSDLLFVLDNENKIIDANTAVIRKYGFSKKELIGSTLSHFGNIKQVSDKILSARKGKPQTIDWWNKSKKGKEFPVEFVLRKGNYFGQEVVIATGRDISERIESEEALKRSEEWYRTLFERNLAGVFRTTLEGKILDCNEAFAHIFGYDKKGELLGKNASQLYFSKEDRDCYLKDLQKDGTVSNYELKHKRKDGSAIWVLANVSISSDDDGTKFLEGTLVDITQQKETDNALRNSEEKFRNLFERNLAGVLQTTIDGLIVNANDAFAKMIGYTSSKQLLKKRTHELFIDKNDRERYLNDLLKSGSLTNHELRLRKKDGSVIWTLANESIIYDAEGNPDIIEGTLIDITELKTTGEALVESESRFKLLAEATIEAIVISDKGVMIDCNDQFSKLFGYSRSDLIGNKMDMIIAPHFRKQVHKYINSGSTEPYEGIGLKKDGTEIIVETTGQYIPYNGNTVRVSVLYDITKRKQYEEELRLSRQTYQSLVDKSPDGIFIHSNGKLKFANPTALKLLGVKDFKKLDGKMFHTLFNKDDAKKIKRRIAMLNKGNTPNYEELRINKINGTEVEIGLQSLNTIYEGKPAIQVTAYDLTQQKLLAEEQLRARIAEAHNTQLEKEITEHKRTQKQLQESEKFIKNIFDSSLDIIMASDSSYKITEINRAAEMAFGYKRKELIGINPEQLYAVATDYKMVRKAIEENGKFSGEITNIKKNGELFTSYLSASIIVDNKGEFQGIMGISRDITELKEAERAIRENQERYQAVYEQAYIGISIFGQDGKFLQANQQLCEMLGYTEAELMEMTYLDVSHPDDIEKSMEYRKKMQKDNLDRISYEKKYLHKSGDIIYVNLTVAQVKDDKGTPQYFISVFEDITERKEAEEILKASLQEKEILLKEVHHRVKNNLQVISSILNLQSSYVKDPGTLNILHESQNRIKSMSFIHESLYQTEMFSSINFSEYIVSLSTNLLHSYQLEEDSVKLIHDVDDVQIMLDQAIPCGLIINELVSNALKYAFKQKEKGEIRVQLKESKEKVILQISDNGKGLPKNFDYRKAESLGLQLVHTLVEQLDGEIKISSKNGTKYLISFVKQSM